MKEAQTITKLILQARKGDDEEWGTLNTVLIPHRPDANEHKAMKQAKAEVQRFKNDWLENYDPTFQFRVVET